MSTSSTRFSVNKKTSSTFGPGESKQTDSSSLDVPERLWRIGALTSLAVGTFLRVYDLNLVPLHHDEGVNGNFLVKLVRDGVYQYDPQNYHGPTLYYFSAFVPWLLQILFGNSARETYGLTTISIRLVPALFGVATIWLILLLRKYVGSIAALSGALLLALSPGAVYLSRYFIHETLFVFFTLGIVVAILRCFSERNPFYLLLAAASAGLMFATKETALISAGVLLIALAITLVYGRLFKHSPSPSRTKRKQKEPSRIGFSGYVYELGGPINVLVWLTLAVLVFLGLNILFYSSFFNNYPKGIYDALRTFDFWSKTGKKDHIHPITTYAKWLFQQESALLLLGSLGAIAAVFNRKRPVGLFCSLWAFGLVAAYSLIPYKTPWLVLNFIVPLAIAAGYAIQTVYENDHRQLRLPAVILFAAICINSYQTVDLNFVNYDNDDTYYVYVYAHTKRDTTELVDEIDKIAHQANQGSTGITIMSPDYWPLPWYLRNYSRVGYYGRLTQTSEPIVIANETQRTEVEGTLGPQYQLVPSGSATGAFALRPGVDLLLYVRR
ncbi:MAG TPA: flippase activity-associated protein Agl23 [Pyrinomonadaceae bacterium]|nr:flippase activity-associated protein Agl23 [Pyrinomonadaceae bacterium]